MNNDLISREALRNEVDTWGCNDYDKYVFLEAIDKAPTVDTGDCENCVFRKFSAKFIDDMVKVMAKNGIESVEQLMEILKGGDK